MSDASSWIDSPIYCRHCLLWMEFAKIPLNKTGRMPRQTLKLMGFSNVEMKNMIRLVLAVPFWLLMMENVYIFNEIMIVDIMLMLLIGVVKHQP